jgi:pyruvate kinase
MKKIKIIATYGPSISEYNVIKNISDEGAVIIRFNFSHADIALFHTTLKQINDLNKKVYSIETIADLKGNRIRVRNIDKPFNINNDDTVNLTKLDVKSTPKNISFDYRYDLKPIKKGHNIFIDDGNIELEVISVSKNDIKTIGKRGGLLKNNKGINVPYSNLYFPYVNEDDLKDIEYISKNSFNYIALSFVRTHRDIVEIKKVLKEKNINSRIISKIENRQALRNISSIIKHSDGIMVARGDLGISIPLYMVPVMQKKLIRETEKQKKFSIVATQIFESMVENYHPTRAEISDMANAVIDGTDCVMFSAETAVGKYPLEAVRIAKKTIDYTRRHISR